MNLQTNKDVTICIGCTRDTVFEALQSALTAIPALKNIVFQRDIDDIAESEICIKLMGFAGLSATPKKVHFSIPVRVGKLVDSIVFLLQSAQNIVSISQGWVLSVQEREVSKVGSVPVKLTEKECEILHFLACSHAPVSRDNLLTVIWGYAKEIDTHTLETHIYRLRQKLEKDPADPKILIFAEGGYCLNRLNAG